MLRVPFSGLDGWADLQSRPADNDRGLMTRMTKVCSFGLFALLVVSGASAADVVSHAAALNPIAHAFDRTDDISVSTPRQAPRSTPGLSRTHRPIRPARYTRAGRGQRRSTTSRYVHSPIVSGLPARGSDLETLRAVLPSRHLLLHYRSSPRAPALN